jgi:hypothetical protein
MNELNGTAAPHVQTAAYKKTAAYMQVTKYARAVRRDLPLRCDSEVYTAAGQGHVLHFNS